MNISEIKLKNFLIHEDTTITLPETGVVVVSGENGHGKSTPIDAVYYALCGKTLRGTPPMTADTDRCAVSLATDVIEIQRGQKKSRKTLSFNKPGEQPVEYETNTKAGDAISAIVDPDNWLRLSVFNANMSSFGKDTDTNRKKFLERILGIEHYDQAYRACLGDCNTAQKSADKMSAELDILVERLSGLYDRLSAELVDVYAEDSGDETQLQLQLQTEIVQLRKRVTELSSESGDFTAKLAESNAELRQLRQKLQLLSNGNCPTCDQEIPDEMVHMLSCSVGTKETEIADVSSKLSERKLEVAKHVSEINEQLHAKQDQLTDVSATIRARSQRNTEIERMTRLRDAAQSQVEDTELALLDLQSALAEHQATVRLKRAVSEVLGPKGFRSKIIAEALEGLSVYANRVLEQLGSSIRVSMSPYSESQQGTVSETIGLQIEGAGGGYGYKALSSGQQRRIDVALLLASAAVAGSDGTLFLDEIFDSLDANATDKIVEMVQELAESRCVVIITHRRDLADSIRASVHYHVVNGEVSSVHDQVHAYV